MNFTPLTMKDLAVSKAAQNALEHLNNKGFQIAVKEPSINMVDLVDNTGRKVWLKNGAELHSVSENGFQQGRNEPLPLIKTVQTLLDNISGKTLVERVKKAEETVNKEHVMPKFEVFA